MAYLGILEYYDPLYEILNSQVFPHVHAPIFHVKRMSKRVYKYTEEKTRIAIIGKFFWLNDPIYERIQRIKGEFDNLNKIRSYGFDTRPNYVAKPITKEERIGLAVVEEFIEGRDLDYYIKSAIHNGNSHCLQEKLSSLANFLYTLHERTKMPFNVNLDSVSSYFYRILDKLQRQTLISDSEKDAFVKQISKWLNSGILEVPCVIAHGDATPTNFIFSGDSDVVAIDLERLKNGDIAYDIGMICGELKHSFLWRTGDWQISEKFIRHFLKSYASHFPDPKGAFNDITRRNPFYMGMTELRIARNEFLDWTYRKRLVYEAMQCLKWGVHL
ncbi:MAG: aminoglycoside phosphotransferase family protein [Thermodesulfovibrionales bacterium]|nr:aminoglycoside phosphotransferase family protein [Thermodesulfovibrionales bacterium]